MSRGAQLHLLGWVLLGLLLRLLRVVARWDELTLAYAAYAEPVTDALSRGELLRAATTWVGLHPPLYGLLQACSELLLPVPLLWLLGSALASTAAVLVVGRTAGPVAAALLATSPLQLADAAEVNNYPLATLLLALALAAAPRWRWPGLALVLVAAGWSHVLAAAGAAGILAWRLLQRDRPAEERPRLVLAFALGMAPVAAGALRRMGQSGTFDQPAAPVSDWLSMVADAVGPEGVVLSVLALVGLRGVVLAGWLPVALALGLALAVGAAAPHQRPYLDLLGPAAALAAAGAVARLSDRLPRHLLLWLVLATCLSRGLRQGVAEVQTAREVLADQQRTRALDVALAESAPGDSLWVVVPALQADDDKSATGPLMWRLRPWFPMPIARPVPFEYTVPWYGQPRAWRGRTVHTATELQEEPFDHVAAVALQQGRIFVVLADHGPATGLRERVERVLRPYAWTVEPVGEDHGLGVDRLYRVTGRATP